MLLALCDEARVEVSSFDPGPANYGKRSGPFHFSYADSLTVELGGPRRVRRVASCRSSIIVCDRSAALLLAPSMRGTPKVAVRVRPFNKREKDRKAELVIKMKGTSIDP